MVAIGAVHAQTNKTVQLVTCEWEPYYGSKLTNNGFITEITRAAFKRSGYELKVDFIPWARALETGKSGKYDGLMGAYFSDERAADFDFSESIYATEIVIMGRKGSGITWKALQDLGAYTIGVVRGYVNSDEFDKATYLKKDEAADSVENIKKLLGSRIDLIVDSKVIVLYSIRTVLAGDPQSVEVVGAPIQVSKLFNAFSKKSPRGKEFLDAFNKGLAAIKKDGTYQAILKQYGY